MTGENLWPGQPTLNLTYVSYSDSHNVRRLASRLSDTSRLLTETDKEVKVLQQAREDLAKCVREQVPREDSLPAREQLRDEVRLLIVLDYSDAITTTQIVGLREENSVLKTKVKTLESDIVQKVRMARMSRRLARMLSMKTLLSGLEID